MKYNELDCVYRKVGNRYKPIGVCEPIDHIPDGIWYVRHKKNSRGLTSMDYIGEMLKVGNSEDITMNTQCGLTDIAEKIMDSNEFRDMMSKGYSLNEMVHLIVRKCYDVSKG